MFYLQRRGIDVAMKMIDEAITENLDVEELLSSLSILGSQTYDVLLVQTRTLSWKES